MNSTHHSHPSYINFDGSNPTISGTYIIRVKVNIPFHVQERKLLESFNDLTLIYPPSPYVILL